VLEVGGGLVSAPVPWLPGRPVAVSADASLDDVGRAVREVLAAGPEPPDILTTESTTESTMTR
jgi:hypothetical protein